MELDKEIVEDFVAESKGLIEDLVTLLEDLEGQYEQVQRLADYGNNVDRIMGGAKSLAQMAPADHAVHTIADYSALCKAVGYKASQIKDNEQLFEITVALLLDATEMLRMLLNNIDKEEKTLKAVIPPAFIERLRWVSNQFSGAYSISVGTGNSSEKMQQSDIDDLLKKLGL